MLKYRNFNDILILTTIPHYFALYYTYQKDMYHSFIILAASSSSILWHKECEKNFYLYTIDHFCAGMLTGYEIYANMNTENNKYIISANVVVFAVHKFFEILENYKLVDYSTGHSIFHVASALKTIFVANI
jgi:hypothetical protein